MTILFMTSVQLNYEICSVIKIHYFVAYNNTNMLYQLSHDVHSAIHRCEGNNIYIYLPNFSNIFDGFRKTETKYVICLCTPSIHNACLHICGWIYLWTNDSIEQIPGYYVCIYDIRPIYILHIVAVFKRMHN